MIELERHIEILLLSNDCVIVPDLGGFMAHHIDANYDEQENIFLPPLRTLGFNPQLKMNDSLLVQSYIEAYDISYPEALRRIQAEVMELKQHLETEGMFEMNDIGLLRLNEEGNMEFEPCEAGILTPSLYGLSTFEMKPLRKEENPTGKHPAAKSKDDNAITIKMSWLRNMVAAAAAAVAFLMITSPISNSETATAVQQSAFIPISTSQKDAVMPEPTSAFTEETAVETDSVETTPVTEETPETIIPTATEQAHYYCIVLASQVSKRNAENFINNLSNLGLNDAHILETKFRRVVYGSYATADEAHAQLKDLRSRSNQFKEAWVMEVNQSSL